MAADWIAVDWGTSNIRAWMINSDGDVVLSAASDKGMAHLQPQEFEAALLELAGGWLVKDCRIDVMICGMAGAKTGWIEAPYRSAPCPPLARGETASPHVRDARLKVCIVPGIKTDQPGHDVMRGEEIQVAGYLAANPRFEGVLCMPGTHTKWVHIKNGQIVSFRTYMSGELFSILSRHSVLAPCLAADGWNDSEFLGAVDTILSRPESLASRLFGIRAASLIADLPPAGAAARLSGFLVGAEIAAAKQYWLGRNLVIIGAEKISRAYFKALTQVGAQPATTDAARVTLAGFAALKRLMAASA